MSTPCIPWKEPETFVAGNTVQWTRTFDNYSANEGWTLYYVFRGPTTIKLTATTYNTSEFLVTIPASVTAGYKPGLYSIEAYVVSGSLRYSVQTWFPLCTVQPDPANYTEGSFDNLTFAARTLAAVETAIFGLSSRKVSSASVNGQSYAIQDINKLMGLRQRMREEVRSEQDAINVAAGRGARKNVLVYFPPMYNAAWPTQEGVPPVSPG